MENVIIIVEPIRCYNEVLNNRDTLILADLFNTFKLVFSTKQDGMRNIKITVQEVKKLSHSKQTVPNY
jgi:hypothetical protein